MLDVFAGWEPSRVNPELKMAHAAQDEERIRTFPKTMAEMREKAFRDIEGGRAHYMERFEALMFSGTPGTDGSYGRSVFTIDVPMDRMCDGVLLSGLIGVEPSPGGHNGKYAPASVLLAPNKHRYPSDPSDGLVALIKADTFAHDMYADAKASALAQGKKPPAEILSGMLPIGIHAYNGAAGDFKDRLPECMAAAVAADYCMRAYKRRPEAAMPSRADLLRAASVVSSSVDGHLTDERLARIGAGRDEDGQLVVLDSGKFSEAKKSGAVARLGNDIRLGALRRAGKQGLGRTATAMAASASIDLVEMQPGTDGALLGIAMDYRATVPAIGLELSHSVAVRKRGAMDTYGPDILRNAGIISSYGDGNPPGPTERMLDRMAKMPRTDAAEGRDFSADFRGIGE